MRECAGGDIGKLVSSLARAQKIGLLMSEARHMAMQGDGEEVILQELDKRMSARWYLSATTRRDYIETIRARIEFEKQATVKPSV